MTLAVILVILAAFLWALTNHVDKFLVCNIDRSSNNVKTLLVFSTLVAGLVLMPLWLIISKFSVAIDLKTFGLVSGAAIFYVLAVYCYFKALENNDASIVIAMQQLMPVFSYILALILFKESLTIKEVIGSAIVVFSAVFISLEFDGKNKNTKFKALFLMFLYSVFGAFYWILLDNSLRRSEYNACIFWLQVDFVIIGIFFLCIKSFRNSFKLAIKKNGKKYLFLNMINEFVNLFGYALVNYANLFIPIALANVISGFQGMFVFIIGAIGATLLPKYFKEDLGRVVIVQKLCCIILGIVGLIIIFM